MELDLPEKNTFWVSIGSMAGSFALMALNPIVKGFNIIAPGSCRLAYCKKQAIYADV
jgi:hypothetical protein